MKHRHAGFKIKKHENGLIAVEQGAIGKYDISFNPDDNRFYVTENDETIATFNRMNNAVYWARKH